MNRDIEKILDNLRKEDRDELFLQLGYNWKFKTLERLKKSKVVLLKNANGVPFAMGGVEGIGEIACVWLLTTDEVKYNKVKLFQEIKKQLDFYSPLYRIYFNYLYKNNYLAKNWLLKLGFCFDNPRPENLKIREGFEFFYRLNNRKEK